MQIDFVKTLTDREQAIQLINQKTEYLLTLSRAYYVEDAPLVTDQEYDKLYDELEALERQWDYYLPGSPTHKVQGEVLKGYTKVKHDKPMLSAQKTKDPAEIEHFVGTKDFYVSSKLDGLTLVVTYEDGKLISAVTRGNGEYGEDVTANARMITNLPLEIDYKPRLVLRGECVMPWKVFDSLKAKAPEDVTNPRSLAAGGVRTLNTNITKERQLSLVVFECITPFLDKTGRQYTDDKYLELLNIGALGFTIVSMIRKNEGCTLQDILQFMSTPNYSEITENPAYDETMVDSLEKYPRDGLIVEFTSRAYSEGLSATSHHEGCRMALKWADEEVETILKDIEWSVGRTGVVVPTAIFDPVEIDNTSVERASLHNKSICEKLKLGIGDTIKVYKANMVIPQVADNLTRSNTLKFPTVCPSCGHALHEQQNMSPNGDVVKVLKCYNTGCRAQFINRMIHFVSRECMNIDGLSEATIELLLANRLIHNLHSLYCFDSFDESKIARLPGFGEKSAKKLLNSIEKSRKTDMAHFINALGIPLIGKSASKALQKRFGTVEELIKYTKYNMNIDIPGFGNAMSDSLFNFFEDKDNMEEVEKLLNILEISPPDESPISADSFCTGKTFCVTGAFETMKRSEIEKIITDMGGKLSGSVSKNTNFLLTNDGESGSSKAKKAKELGTPIMSEKEFLEKIGR